MNIPADFNTYLPEFNGISIAPAGPLVSCAFEFIMAFILEHKHDFKFNEAISLVVMCQDQAEIDYFYEKMSAVPESEQCGWIKDAFGVSWQIVSPGMAEMLNDPDKEKADRAMNAMMQMKKIDIAKLQAAFEGA